MPPFSSRSSRAVSSSSIAASAAAAIEVPAVTGPWFWSRAARNGKSSSRSSTACVTSPGSAYGTSGVWPTRITKYGVSGGTALRSDHGGRQAYAAACALCRWTTAVVAGSRW